jgi:hypothetical protein
VKAHIRYRFLSPRSKDCFEQKRTPSK